MIARSLLLAPFLLLALARCSSAKGPPREAPAVTVRVGKAIRKDVPIQVSAAGNVQAYSTVTVKALVEGEIVRVAFRDGQLVRKGDLLFEIDPRPFEAALSMARAALARDRAQAANARADARRYGDLIAKGYVTQQQYDSACANADALGAQADADEAAVRKAQLDLDHCTLRSPIGGRTGSALVKAGNLVKANDTQLVVIEQIRPVYVAFSLPESFLPQVRGERRLRVAVRPRDGDPEHQGELTFVDNAVDVSTGTILCKSTFPNADQALWPGQFVDAVVTIGEWHAAVVVPSAAVQRGQAGSWVFVVKPDMTVESRPVAVSGSTAEEAVVGGVNPGETVVTDGQLRLRPGSRVTVVETAEASR